MLPGNNIKLKRLLAMALCVLAALCFAYVPAFAAEETLRVGIPTDRCPIFYLDAETGEPVGIGVDLMRTAAEAAGYRVSFTAITEETVKDALDNPAYDVLMPFGSAIRSSSGQPSIVTDNFIQTPFTLVTEDSRNLPTLNELRIGMVHSLAGAADTVRQLYPGVQIRLCETMDESVEALRRGEVDALLHNSYVWSYVLQKPAYSDLAVRPSAMFSMDFRAGTADSEKGREIVSRLNGAIADMSETQRQAIILDYTSRRLYHYDFSDYVHAYWLVLLLIALLFVAVIIIAAQRIRAMRREHERKLRQMIDHDPLTGLLSMEGFRKRVETLLREHPDTPYFLSYNNIRNFKYINETLGRSAGDSLLRFWAQKSLENLGEEETIGRITADRFAVLRHIVGEERMLSDVKNVFEPLQNFFIRQGKDFRVQVCSGIYVLSPRDFREIDVDHMLDKARVAEKKARDDLRDDYAFFNPEQWEKGKKIADVVNYLPNAIRDGDICVWYQPQVNDETGEITGAEALCRWNHSKLGFLHPAEFISTLEESGLIFELDQYVWDRVCQDLRRWNGQGRRRTVSVNVSRGDFREERDIPAHFSALIRNYGLSPDQLRIEITETAFVERPGMLIGATEKLRELGFQVEMDDFGSGYSSLHMLKEVPVDRIKLDLHFLTASGDAEKCRVIVSHMIQMVSDLGMTLVSEGVETAEQARFLREHGCTDMQGYYYYKPMPVDEFEKLF